MAEDNFQAYTQKVFDLYRYMLLLLLLLILTERYRLDRLEYNLFYIHTEQY